MRVLVVGATGGLGRAALKLALAMAVGGRSRVIGEAERGGAGVVVRSRLANLWVHAAETGDCSRRAIVAGH